MTVGLAPTAAVVPECNRSDVAALGFVVTGFVMVPTVVSEPVTPTDEGLAVVCVTAAPLAIVHPAVPDTRLTPVKLTDVVPV